MADGTPTFKVPPGCFAIVRNAQSATTLYTVPAGFRLHINMCWASIAGGVTAGSVILTATPEGDSAQTILRTETGVTTQANLVLPHLDIPIAAAGTVVSSTAGTVPAAFTVGFSGWLEQQTK